MSTLIFGFRGPYKYRMNNCRRTAKLFPTWGLSQKYCSGLKWLDVKVLQRNIMLWDIPWSKYSNVIPGMSVFIGHASRSPERNLIGLNVILIYLTLMINFNYSIPFSIIHNTSKWKEDFFFKRNHLCICSKLWLVN